ncbi:methionyl-tRNA formyltransferase [Chitinophagaceae bacterium LWZ2-11]
MKTILLCNSDRLPIPAVVSLHNTGQLKAIGIPEKAKHVLIPVFVNMGIEPKNIYTFNKQNIEATLPKLVDEYNAEVIFVMTFPWKLPTSVLTYPPKGCINFHFGLLPKYKGADPIFWQLKNVEQAGGIAIHTMTDEIDAGPILLQQTLPVIRGETYGIHCKRLSTLVPDLLQEVYKKLREEDQPAPSDKQGAPASYYKAPEETDLTINWQHQSANEIQYLVNAANPRYGGAITSIHQNYIRFLEVMPADLNTTSESNPGMIVYADALYGLVIQCINKEFLKLNVAQLNEGFFSGSKLFHLGFKVGDIFV